MALHLDNKNALPFQKDFFSRPVLSKQAIVIGGFSILFTLNYAFITFLAYVDIGVSIQYETPVERLQYFALALPYFSFIYSIFLTVKTFSSYEDYYAVLIVTLFMSNVIALPQSFF